MENRGVNFLQGKGGSCVPWEDLYALVISEDVFKIFYSFIWLLIFEHV